MNYVKEMCCLCLSDTNSTYTNLFLKDIDGSNCFDKISIHLPQLANVLKELDCNDYSLCEKCHDTIEMIYKFNQFCLSNVKKYSLKRKLLENVRILEIVHTNNETELTNKRSPQDICEEVKETNDENIGSSNVNDIFWESSYKDVDFEEKNCVKEANSTQKNYDKQATKKKVFKSKKSYICEDCKKTFRFKSDFDKHKLIHSDMKPYTCHICGKSYKRENVLNSHMLVHTDEKPHVCCICNKGFRNKNNLEKHNLIHSGEKRYLCDYCGKSFSHKHHLIIHKRIHSGERPYVCDTCSKTFIDNISLVRHKLIHSAEKRYLCDQCEKSFAQQQNLVKHRKLHTGIKPYVCDLCHKAFAQRCNLNRHIQDHTDERPFSCNTCFKTFKRKTSLNRHLRNVHKN